MSDIPRDKEFYELADAYIALANTRMGKTKPAARFNAFVFSVSAENKAQMLLDKESAIAYFMQEYEKNLRENIDEHLARHDN
jgi:hypothetical protein